MRLGDLADHGRAGATARRGRFRAGHVVLDPHRVIVREAQALPGVDSGLVPRFAEAKMQFLVRRQLEVPPGPHPAGRTTLPCRTVPPIRGYATACRACGRATRTP